MSRLEGWPDRDEASVEDGLSILESIASDHSGGPVEAFHRSSTLRRLELDGRTRETSERLGREQGGALRWIDPRSATSAFAAASGGLVRSLSACRALTTEGFSKATAECPWSRDAASEEDFDPHCDVPDAQELREWLLQTAPEALDEAWVEAGRTEELRLTGPNSVQRRVRGRAWAYWLPLGGRFGARPLILAARTWPELRRKDPARAWSRRSGSDDAGKPWPADAELVFSPETSAFLVLLLTRVAHAPGVELGTPVGPGWVLSAYNTDTLLGSAFDDAGFAVEPRLLADGHRTLGRWGGTGALRRGSFRDVPESTPIPLVLSPQRVDPPKRAVWVTRVDVHPTGGTWLFRLHGRRYPEGADFEPTWTRWRPLDLLRSCVGGIGSPSESHTGVTTPSLVFNPLLITN